MGLITDIATEIGNVFSELELVPDLKVQMWVPAELPKLPCVVIVPPNMEFPGGVWGDGDQLSTLQMFQWNLEYHAELYIELDNSTKGQQRAVDFAESVVKAVQVHPGLNGQAQAAKVESATLEFVTDSKASKHYLTYDFTISVLREEPEPF